MDPDSVGQHIEQAHSGHFEGKAEVPGVPEGTESTGQIPTLKA